MLRTLTVAATLVAVTLGASACASPEAASTDATTPPPASSPAAPVDEAAAEIPTDCTDIVSAEVYSATFADLPLNDPAAVGDLPHGAVEPVASSPGATAATVLDDSALLRCLWRDPDADVTGLLATIGTVDTAVAETRTGEMAAEGYTCEARLEGTICQRVETDPQYGVEVATTAFLRDDTWILVDQSNVPTHDLIGAIVERLWR
jgi:hypothetical protein